MARIEVEPSSAPQPESEEVVPQISEPASKAPVSEFQQLQGILDAARLQQKSSAPAPTTPQYEDPSSVWEDLPSELAKKFEDFFDTPTVSKVFTEHGYTFKVRTLDSSHFLDPKNALVLPEVSTDNEDSTKGYMEFFRVLYMYFIRSLVHVEKGSIVLSAKELSGNLNASDPDYYKNIAKNLAKKITLDKMVDIVMEYAKFFNEQVVPGIEKKN